MRTQRRLDVPHHLCPRRAFTLSMLSYLSFRAYRREKCTVGYRQPAPHAFRQVKTKKSGGCRNTKLLQRVSILSGHFSARMFSPSSKHQKPATHGTPKSALPKQQQALTWQGECSTLLMRLLLITGLPCRQHTSSSQRVQARMQELPCMVPRAPTWQVCSPAGALAHRPAVMRHLHPWCVGPEEHWGYPCMLCPTPGQWCGRSSCMG